MLRMAGPSGRAALSPSALQCWRAAESSDDQLNSPLQRPAAKRDCVSFNMGLCVPYDVALNDRGPMVLGDPREHRHRYPRPMRSNATPCPRQVSWLVGRRRGPAFPGSETQWHRLDACSPPTVAGAAAAFVIVTAPRSLSAPFGHRWRQG